MALIKCPECTNEVSTSAAACPKCGAPIHSINESIEIPKGKVQCVHCQAVITPQKRTANASSIIITILLLLLGIIPGLIYAIWESSRKQCPSCNMVIK